MSLVRDKEEKPFQLQWPFSQPEALKSRPKNRIGMQSLEGRPELRSVRKVGAPA